MARVCAIEADGKLLVELLTLLLIRADGKTSAYHLLGTQVEQVTFAWYFNSVSVLTLMTWSTIGTNTQTRASILPAFHVHKLFALYIRR